jgi:hypothetical protein
MNVIRTAQALTAATLGGTAAILRLAGDAVGTVAAVIKPRERREDDRLPAAEEVVPAPAAQEPAEAPAAAAAEEPAVDRSPAEEVAESYAARGRVKERTQVDAVDDPRATAPPTHVAEVARGSVASVVEAIDDLSTDQLRLLHEHETSHKNRKGVLEAIERALT